MALQRGCLQVDGETQTIGFARERSHARRLADMRIRSQMAFAGIAFMIIRINPSLKNTKGYEYALRFVLGGLATVFTGLIASFFGPVAGGLFLAFPAIFCAASRSSKSTSASGSRNWA